MKRAEKLPYSPLYWLLFSAVQVSRHLAAEESYGLSGVENQTKPKLERESMLELNLSGDQKCIT